VNGLGTAVASKIDSLLDCICAGLTSQGAGPTCWCGFYPGTEVSWDYCGECSGGSCGMGYVRMVNSYRSSIFPNADVSLNCIAPIVVELVVGSLRCIPVSDEQGALPDEGSMWESSLGILADMTALFDAIACCGMDHAIGNYTPLGAQGGCAGGEWQVWLSL